MEVMEEVEGNTTCRTHAPVHPSWWRSCRPSQSPWPGRCNGFPALPACQPATQQNNPSHPRLINRSQWQHLYYWTNQRQLTAAALLTSWQMELMSAPDILSGRATSEPESRKQPIIRTLEILGACWLQLSANFSPTRLRFSHTVVSLVVIVFFILHSFVENVILIGLLFSQKLLCRTDATSYSWYGMDATSYLTPLARASSPMSKLRRNSSFIS